MQIKCEAQTFEKFNDIRPKWNYCFIKNVTTTTTATHTNTITPTAISHSHIHSPVCIVANLQPNIIVHIYLNLCRSQRKKNSQNKMSTNHTLTCATCDENIFSSIETLYFTLDRYRSTVCRVRVEITVDWCCDRCNYVIFTTDYHFHRVLHVFGHFQIFFIPPLHNVQFDGHVCYRLWHCPLVSFSLIISNAPFAQLADTGIFRTFLKLGNNKVRLRKRYSAHQCVWSQQSAIYKTKTKNNDSGVRSSANKCILKRNGVEIKSKKKFKPAPRSHNHPSEKEICISLWLIEIFPSSLMCIFCNERFVLWWRVGKCERRQSGEFVDASSAVRHTQYIHSVHI